MTAEALPEKKSRPASIPVPIRLALIAAPILAVFSWVWWHTVNHTPVASVPPVSMPAHNAYESYMAASRAVVNSGALNNMRFSAQLMRGRWVLRPLRDRERLLDQNRRALTTLREGLQLEYRQPPLRTVDDFTTVYRFQNLPRLLALDMSVRAEHGDWEGSASALLDQIAFSESLMRGAGADTVLSAARYRGLALPGTADPIEHLNSEQLRSVANRLEKIVSRRIPFCDILSEEKWSQLSMRDQLLSRPNWRDALANNNMTGNTTLARFSQLRTQARWLAVDKRRVLLDYSRYMDNCIALARGSSNVIPPYPAAPSDPVNSQLAADIAGSHRQYALITSDGARLLLRIAIRRYFLEHGVYPPSLEALCPAIIQRLPTDPFNPNGNFTYKRTDNSYTMTGVRTAPAQPLNPFDGQNFGQY
jgi:hypothetical protein